MAIPHSFVLARLLPNDSLRFVSSRVGHAVARRMDPQPFAALRLEARDIDGFRPDYLLPVSTEKPPAEFPGYVSVFPNQDGARHPIRLVPPLPHDAPPYYVHTGIPLKIKLERHDRNNWKSSFVIDPSDFDRLYNHVLEDIRGRFLRERARRLKKVGTGGNDEAGSKWSTFSGRDSSTDSGLNKRFDLVFELSLLSDFTPMELTIYDEIKLLKRIGDDFSWVGVSNTLRYIKDLEASSTTPLPNISTDIVHGKVQPTPHALALRNMSIPFDGDKPPEPEPVKRLFVDDDDDDEYWFPQLPQPPEALPRVSLHTNNLRVVCFDTPGTILDRETTIKRALKPILDKDPKLRTEVECLSSYLVCEAQHIPQTPRQRAIASLRDLCALLSVEITDEEKDVFVEQMVDAKALVFSDVPRALQAFKRHGCRIVAVLPPNITSTDIEFDHEMRSDAPHLPLSPSHLSSLLTHCRETYGADPAQVLLVTSSAYRGIETGSLAGMPTVHIRRTNAFEGSDAATTLVPMRPSLEVENLEALCHELGIKV